jgi:hypothetical protein
LQSLPNSFFRIPFLGNFIFNDRIKDVDFFLFTIGLPASKTLEKITHAIFGFYLMQFGQNIDIKQRVNKGKKKPCESDCRALKEGEVYIT